MRTAVVQDRHARASLLLLVGAVLAAVSFQPVAQGQRDATAFERLAQTAGADGTVGVIVHLEVPGLTALTAASAGVPTQAGSQAVTDRRNSADAMLRAAIDNVTGDLLTELQGTDATVNARYGSIPFLALRVSAGALARLQASPAVLGIEEDVAVGLIDPEDGGRSTSAADTDRPQLDNAVNLIGASTAWSWGYTGAGWYVAVLDTGIRKSHQFFSGKNIVEACRARGASGSGDCPNGSASQNGSGSAVHVSSTYAGYDHGTHVAGIAAGNFGSLAGVAKNANIVAVNVFHRVSGSDCGSSGGNCVLSFNSDQLAGLDYIYSIRGSYNIASVNMSIGGGGPFGSSCDSDSRKAAIDNLRAAGIVTAISTGNDKYCTGVGSPACVSSAVAVGASTDSDAESFFNNWHPVLQKLFAPGYEIRSSTGASDSSYASWSGTSMAAPHVTGAWALLKQVIPNGSVPDFLNALRNQGVPITSTCDSRRTPIPRIRVDRAISSLVRYLLTIQSSANGTTDPRPGSYYYAAGTPVLISAAPDTYATFVDWSNGATGNANPLTVTMDQNKTVFANFRYIFAPVATGLKVLNRTFSQAEYISILSWQPHAANQGLDINRYRIYRMNGGTAALLAEVAAGASTFEYRHRNAGQAAIQYAIVAVTGSDREGFPAFVTVQ